MNDTFAMAQDFLRIEASGAASTHWTLQEYLEELRSEHSQVFRWSCEDKVHNGFVLFRVLFDEAWIMNLAVEQKGQGQGLKMWDAFISFLRAHHPALSSVGLEVSERNRAALALYRRAGFAEIGRRAAYYRDASAAIVLKLEFRH